MNIKLVDIVKVFKNGKCAINNLNLNIKDGEFIALLGPSGCGKTTTLMLVSGLYKPTKGKIYFGDKLINDFEPKDRNIGMVFQSYALYPHFTVYENIAFPLKQKKVPKGEIDQRVKRVAKLVRIDELLDRKPSRLSGGQQQRVSMARALVKNPGVLLLDEPMSNLDTRLKIEVREEIRRLQKQLNVTSIIVTHDQEEAMAIADRIAILDKGKIQQFAAPHELFSRPKNIFVANFMGNPPMNFLNGKLFIDNDGRWIVNDSFKYKIPEEIKLSKKYNKKNVILGVRPHQLKLDKSGKNSIKADIVFIEYLGREGLIKTTVGDQLVRVIVSTEEIKEIKGNDSVFLEPETKGIQIFLEETGENIVS